MSLIFQWTSTFLLHLDYGLNGDAQRQTATTTQAVANGMAIGLGFASGAATGVVAELRVSCSLRSVTASRAIIDATTYCAKPSATSCSFGCLTMTFLLAALELSGADPEILRVDRYLDKPLYGKPWSTRAEHAPVYHAMVLLIDEELNEAEGVSRVLEWMNDSKQKLLDLSSRRVLEIQSGLEQGEGSRFLTIPAAGIQVLAELDCELTHQFMQSGSER